MLFFHASGYSIQDILKIDVDQIFTLYQNEIFSLPQYHKIIDIVANTDALSSVLFADVEGNIPVESEQQKATLDWYFSRFLSEYIYLITGSYLILSSHKINYIYEKLEQYILSKKTFNGVWSAHLRNVTSDVGTIKLSHNIFIREATDEEKEESL